MADNYQWALGLMSGTSLDGIDAALICSDGQHIAELSEWLSIPYDKQMRQRLACVMYGKGDVMGVERDFTQLCAQAVNALLKKVQMPAEMIRVIGFHGQTIDHRPEAGLSWQIGNGALLAAQTGIDVVCDFRRRDMAEGGQGAPLVPLFHAALCQQQAKPLAVLNIGGISNVTYIGEDESQLMAFDTGPGNVLMNQLAERALDTPYDAGGALAATGTADSAVVTQYLEHSYFTCPPPKSLDRQSFTLDLASHLPLADSMATLLEFTAQSIAHARAHLPAEPKQWLVCGGGVYNHTLMQRLSALLGNVSPMRDARLAPDAIEAQAFAYFALRSLHGLPLTLPQLTGAARAVSGGALYRA